MHPSGTAMRELKRLSQVLTDDMAPEQYIDRESVLHRDKEAANRRQESLVLLKKGRARTERTKNARWGQLATLGEFNSLKPVVQGH